MTHIFKTRVYYEDTDSGGIVYYANYLKFIERARTELIYKLGFSLEELSEKYDNHFVVKNINCNFLYSAKLEDILSIKSQLLILKKTYFELDQSIYRFDNKIFKAKVCIVCINNSNKPTKICEKLRVKIESEFKF